MSDPQSQSRSSVWLQVGPLGGHIDPRSCPPLGSTSSPSSTSQPRGKQPATTGPFGEHSTLCLELDLLSAHLFPFFVQLQHFLTPHDATEQQLRREVAFLS